MNNNQMGNDWFKKGNDHYQAKRYEEANRCYDQALKIDPKNIRIWNNKGLSFNDSGYHEDAIFCYRKALAINPQYVSAWCNLGISLDALQRFGEALRCFDTALEFDAKQSIIWQKKGDTLRNIAPLIEVIRCYQMAVKLDANNILAWYNKGLCEDKLGLNAYSSYSNVMALAMGIDGEFVTDNGAGALEARRIEPVKIKREYYDYAIKRLDELDARDNPSVSVQKNIVNHDVSQDLTPAAPLHQNKASLIPAEKHEKPSFSHLHEQNANHWYIKGKQLCDLKNYEEAIHCFELALKLEPQYAYAWREKAYCEGNLGRTFDAIHSYEQVLEFADDELGLIQDAVACLAELEKDDISSINFKESIVSQPSKTDRKIIDQPTDATYQPGDVIGQEYEVQSVLGRGGFGDVYLVINRQNANIYAMKTFQDKFLADSKIRDLFRKEANILIELGHHPNLVRTYFVEEYSGRLFIILEYIAPNEQGLNSLAGYLQNRPPELSQSLRWAIQICFGMEYAYSKGIRAHRDLKPENIMIAQDGTAKVTDFGLAGRLASLPANSTRMLRNIGQSEKTQMGDWFGTLTHMPPEQFDNAAGCDERSDIYAFGIVLFQMVTGGRLPFQAIPLRNASQEENMRFWLDMKQLHSEASVPRLDSPLISVIQHCLEKKSDKRYQSFKHLRQDLESMLKKQNGEIIIPPQLRELDIDELNQKGVSLVNLGRHEEAIYWFEQVLKINPQYAHSWNNRGSSLNQLGRYEEAIYCFDKALKINPQYAHAWNGKGICLASQKRHVDALYCFNQAVKFNPQDGKAWSNKGVSLATQGHHEDAILSFNEALILNQMDRDAWNNKGFSLWVLNCYAEALRCYNHALEIDPQNASACINKGKCLAIQVN